MMAGISFQTRGSVPELVRRASTQLALAVASTTSTSPQQQSAAVPSDSTHATSQAKQHDVADTEQPQREDPKVKKKLVRTKSALFKYNSLSRSTSEGKPSFPQLSVTTSATPLSPPADSGGGDDDETVTVAAAPEVSSGLVLPASAPPSATLATQEDLEDEEDETPRPRFETPKEKECWQLYRKMCEKGLTVSFDTVLRGMLTPTEYRLRRGALLSTC
ncbi:hypothetical protein B566_EDAN004040 [Ephemera danica]|nr:hypothetical protein B566_EDAN004040 [Ephemera danica]